MTTFKFRIGQSAAGCFLMLALSAIQPYSFGQVQSTAPDNSVNNRDQSTTADQQSENAYDLSVTKRIRREIMADKSLSSYAHNVKVVTRNGEVTLKGPVRSVEEKQNIASKAAQVAGSSEKVSNQLTVKQ